MASDIVVAIMATQAGREGLALRAMHCFESQLYVPRKHMVIVSPSPESLLIVGGELGLRVGDREMYSVIAKQPNQDLEGMLAALAYVRQQFGPSTRVCFWDDDDQSHPLRLARQAAVTRPGRPSYLTGAFYHFFDSAELFVLERDVRFQPLSTRVIFNSIMIAVEDLPDLQKLARRGNLGAGIGDLVLKAISKPAVIAGEWWWLKIGVRGDNARGYSWHREQAVSEKAMNRGWLLERKVLIEPWLRQYAWDGLPSCFDLCGPDGMAWRFDVPPDSMWLGFPPIGEPAGIIKKQEVIV